MKHNFTFLLVAMAALSAALVGCEPKEDVDIDKLATQMVQGSFEKTPVRSLTVMDGLTTTVTEWTLMDTVLDQISCCKLVCGNGVYTKTEPVLYHYELVNKVASGLGFNYRFTDVNGQVKNVLYWGNSIVVDGDTVGQTATNIANIETIMGSFPNHKWQYEEMDYQILYDTITKMDTTITPVRRPDPTTGRPIVVYDTTIAEVTIINADTVGIQRYYKSMYTFNHDDNTARNTGSQYEYVARYKMNADSTAMEPDGEPTEMDLKFEWGFNTITSTTRFALNLFYIDNLQMEEVKLSGFSLTKGTLVFDGVRTYTLVEPN